MGKSKVDRRLWAVVGIVVLVLIWSGIDPKDRFTWFLEVAPVLIGLPILLFLSRRGVPVTPLLLGLLGLHAVILMVGGRYTYAEVPLGFWMQEWFGFARNHYDRIGHFAQGFVPAILFREVLLRKKAIRSPVLLFVVVSSFCLSFSAIYEFIEWFTALATGEAAEAFLGTQGDPWDTQWDMFLALSGSLFSQIILSGIHGRQMNVSTVPPGAGKRPVNTHGL